MSDINISLIKIEGKPIEKLIETISSAIGVIYNPSRIRRDAEAESNRIIAVAKAKASEMLILNDAENELLQRASKRFINQEINHQKNIESIADISVKHLNEDVSDTPVSEDWKQFFFNKAKSISHEGLQDFWAKLLAQEVNYSGSVSIEALDLLSRLSPNEAKLFERTCKYLFNNNYIIAYGSSLYFDNIGIGYASVIELQDLGILHGVMKNITLFHNAPSESYLYFNNFFYRINTKKPFEIPAYILTNRARLLCESLRIPSDTQYVDLVMSKLIEDDIIEL